MPEVSVIIPTYNSVRYLTQAIDSVLAQTFRDYEILVIDDGSTDETEEALRCYADRARYIRQQNSGVAVARNRGIAESRGRYIAFLDADDTWLPHKLELQLEALASHRSYLACHSAFSVVAADLTPLYIHRIKRVGSTLEDLLMRGNVIGSICTVLCERSLFETAKDFDPALSQCADWDMWIRLAALTEFLYIDDPLVTYRQHDNNMSRNAALLEYDSISLLEKGFSMVGIPPSLREKRRTAFARNYMVLAGRYFHARSYSDFTRCAARAISMDFRQANYLLAYPSRVVTRLRSGRFAGTT
jgi:glycosyltransferase involved in cell wall biosynthesis